MLAAAEAGIPVEEYAPLEVKMAVTGVAPLVENGGGNYFAIDKYLMEGLFAIVDLDGRGAVALL